MHKYILVMLTSNGCGHCSAIRGNGEINNSKYMMNYDFLKVICDKINMFNIHYSNMQGQNEQIIEISKFHTSNGKLRQEKYSLSGNKTNFCSFVATSNKNTKKSSVITKNIYWSDFLKNKISSKLVNYTYYFPCFIIFKTQDWNRSLKGELDQLMGITNAGVTIIENGEVKLYKNSVSINQRNIELTKLIDDAIQDKLNFNPKSIEEIQGKPKDEKPKDEKPKDEKPKDEKPKDEKPKDKKPKKKIKVLAY